jgi:hypothetical protein
MVDIEFTYCRFTYCWFASLLTQQIVRHYSQIGKIYSQRAFGVHINNNKTDFLPKFESLKYNSYGFIQNIKLL